MEERQYHNSCPIDWIVVGPIGQAVATNSCNSLNNGAPGEIRTPDRLVRRHTSDASLLPVSKQFLLVFIPNKFPPFDPEVADFGLFVMSLLGMKMAGT